MAGMSIEETRSYMLHHLKIAGRTDPLFEENAFEPIHRLSQGLPRRVNNLCLAAMTLAMAKKLSSVNADIVVQAGAGL
jgi:type II secretory pathway predicted ATPase ExeA